MTNNVRSALKYFAIIAIIFILGILAICYGIYGIVDFYQTNMLNIDATIAGENDTISVWWLAIDGLFIAIGIWLIKQSFRIR